jgi:hypothetical protein
MLITTAHAIQENCLKALQGISRQIILVGINWSKRKAKHDVKIEVVEG